MSEYRPRIVYMGLGIIAFPKTRAEYDSLMKHKRITGYIFAGFLAVATIVIMATWIALLS